MKMTRTTGIVSLQAFHQCILGTPRCVLHIARGSNNVIHLMIVSDTDAGTRSRPKVSVANSGTSDGPFAHIDSYHCHTPTYLFAMITMHGVSYSTNSYSAKWRARESAF